MTTLIPNTYTQCPTALIVTSTTNRKHFNPEALQALSDNIKARGIDQPIIVRALPGSRLADTRCNPVRSHLQRPHRRRGRLHSR